MIITNKTIVDTVSHKLGIAPIKVDKVLSTYVKYINELALHPDIYAIDIPYIGNLIVYRTGLTQTIKTTKRYIKIFAPDHEELKLYVESLQAKLKQIMYEKSLRTGYKRKRYKHSKAKLANMKYCTSGYNMKDIENIQNKFANERNK